MAHSSFGKRLGYAIWLSHLAHGKAPSHAELGRQVKAPGHENGVAGQTIGKWTEYDLAPKDWRFHHPLASALGVDEAWLVKGKGDTPRADLWPIWLEARRLDEIAPKVATSKFPPAETRHSAKKKPAKPA